MEKRIFGWMRILHSSQILRIHNATVKVMYGLYVSYTLNKPMFLFNKVAVVKLRYMLKLSAD